MQIFVYLHLACDVIGDLEVNKVGFRSTNLAELSNVMWSFGKSAQMFRISEGDYELPALPQLGAL